MCVPPLPWTLPLLLSPPAPWILLPCSWGGDSCHCCCFLSRWWSKQDESTEFYFHKKYAMAQAHQLCFICHNKEDAHQQWLAMPLVQQTHLNSEGAETGSKKRVQCALQILSVLLSTTLKCQPTTLSGEILPKHSPHIFKIKLLHEPYSHRKPNIQKLFSPIFCMALCCLSVWLNTAQSSHH